MPQNDANATTPNSKNTTVILIDLQIGSLRTVRSMEQQKLKNNAIAFAKITQILQLPVIIAAAKRPGEGGKVISELTDILPSAKIIEHSTTNIWESSELVNTVKQIRRKHLAMAGIATDVGLCLPAIAAVKAGYSVSAIVDISGTLDRRIEQAAWLRMTQAGVSLTSWTGFTGEIQHDYSVEPGAKLLEVIGEQMDFDID